MNNKLPFTKTEYILLLLTGIYLVASCLAAYVAGVMMNFDFLLYVPTATIFTLALFQIFIIYYGLKILRDMIVLRPHPLRHHIWSKLKEGPFNKELYMRALPVFISIFIFLSIFTNMKGLISHFGTYEWDPIWAELDRLIHFGIDPWRLLQPLLGYPLVTLIINFFYNLWLPIMFVMLYWQLLSRKYPELRLQFFYTFILSWGINGTLLAILFASGGPCFYEQMIGENYYGPLMDYLNSVRDQYGLWALDTQEMLWERYQDSSIMIGGGISAMPSVHVATAFLYLLLGLKMNKFWLGLFGFYFVLILIGSVHLGWHYAIDGYLSILTTWLFWFISGKIILHNTPESVTKAS